MSVLLDPLISYTSIKREVLLFSSLSPEICQKTFILAVTPLWPHTKRDRAAMLGGVKVLRSLAWPWPDNCEDAAFKECLHRLLTAFLSFPFDAFQRLLVVDGKLNKLMKMNE